MPRPLLPFACVLLLVTSSKAPATDAITAVPERDFPLARQPQVAVDPAGTVYLVFGSGDAVHCAVSRDGGKSYEAPVKVGSAGTLALGMRRGPRVAATEKAVVVTAICGEKGKGADGDLLAWRSTDAGKTWQGPATINSVPGSAREGLHHTTASATGTVGSVWLDLREKKKMLVYSAVSTDGGASWHNERLVYQSPDGSVCPCCQPQATFDPWGSLHVMWRNDLAGARDMYLATSKDTGKTFGPAMKLGEGTWPLQLCPMDGGGLAVTPDAQAWTIWRRGKEMFRCVAGRKEESLGKGEQGWAASGAGGVYFIWIEARPGALRILTPGAEKPALLADMARDPVVAGPTRGTRPVIAAWEEGKPNAIRIRTAVLAQGR